MAHGEDATRRDTEHLSEIVWLMDAELTEVQYVDRTYEELTGRATDRAGSGLDSLDLVHAEDRDAFREWLDGIRADVAAGDVDDRYDSEFRLVDPEGNERWMTSAVMPVREDGAVTTFAGVSVDVTGQVERERELRERIERLDDFASMVSHDLRNPLSIARGHLDLFRETRDDEHLERIEASLSRIEELAGEMLGSRGLAPRPGRSTP